MSINKTARVVAVNIIFIFLFSVFQSLFTGKKVLCQDQDDKMTISAEEIKDEEEKEKRVISIEDVEKARVVTDERIYALVVLWLLILLAIYLISCQSREDERLYRKGYYNKET